MASLILHNKMGSITEIQNSVVGVNGTVNGTPVTGAVKFGNGSELGNATASNWAKFPNALTTSIMNNPFTISFWAKGKYASNSANSLFFMLPTTDAVGYPQIWIANSSGYIGVYVYDTGSPTKAQYRYSNIGVYAQDEIFHVACVFDKSAAAQNKIKLYINGVLQTPTAYTYDNAWTMGSDINIMSFVASANQPLLDNLKVYDYAKTDFTDRLWEGTGIPANVAASAGTYTDKVRITWDAAVGDLTGYKVYRATSSGGSFSDISGLISSGETFDDTTAEPDTHYFYKVTSLTSLAESDYSSEVEGYAETPAPVFTIQEDARTITQPKVLLLKNEIDIFDREYISDIPDIIYERTFQRQNIILNEISLDVKNFDDMFSVNNSKSIFKNIKWKYEPVKIYDKENRKLWDGVITDIIRNHEEKTASIQSMDILSSVVNRLLEYSSSDWETPARAFINIMEQEGLEYDEVSANRSDAIYILNGCAIKCVFALEDNATIQQAMEKLAQICCADIWQYNNKIYFSHTTPFDNSAVNIDINPDVMLSLPVVSSYEDDMINDYNISYYDDGEVPAIDSDNGNIGQASRIRYGIKNAAEINGRANEQIIIKDLDSAVYIGESIIKRTHKALSSNPQPLEKIEFCLSIIYNKELEIGTYITLTLEDEGWIDKVFQVFGMTVSHNENKISVMALEVV